MIKFILWLLLTVAGAILYRMGGSDSWNTKWRDIGVSLTIVAVACLFWPIKGIVGWISMFATFGLSWGALTTYHYFLPKPVDYTWPYYALQGFMVSLASIFTAWACGLWWLLVIRCIVCPVLVGFWSWLVLKVLQPKYPKFNWAVPHECGRGAIITGCAAI